MSVSWRAENRELLRLAFPTIISTLSVPFVTVANTAMVGHLPGAWPLAAVAMGGVVYGVLVTVLSPFRGLAIAMTGRWYGEQAHDKATDWTLWGLVIALLAGGLLAAAGPLFALFALRFFAAEGQLREAFQVYLATRMLELPFVVGQMFLLGHLRGFQRAWLPMAVTVVVAIASVVLTALFVYGLGWGVRGAALAAVAANALGFAVSLWGWWRALGPTSRLARWWAHRALLLELRHAFGWGVARSLLLMGTLAAFTAAASHLGAAEVAAHGVLMELWLLSSYAIDGFAYGLEALVARRLGERDGQRLRVDATLGLLWCLVVGGVFSLIYGLAGAPIAALFTGEAAVAIAAGQAMLAVVLLQPVVAVAYWADGILTGAVDLKGAFMTLVAGLALGLLVLPWSREAGLLGVWWGVTAFSLGRSLWALKVCWPYLTLKREAGAH